MNDDIHLQLNSLVDRAVQSVLASSFRKRKMREELLGHLTAVFEMEAARLGDETAALKRTQERFGDPVELTQQLQQTVTPLGYVAWFLDSMWLLRGDAVVINHQRLYNILVFTLCVYIAGGMGVLAWVIGMPPEARPDMQWPDWSLPMLAVLNGFYLWAMGITLVARFAWPGWGRHLTRVLNILLLLGPPLGTALGIYGLWKVDGDPDPRREARNA